jgi:hypothetical protein
MAAAASMACSLDGRRCSVRFGLKVTHSGGSPPTIDALRKVHSPGMLAVSDKAGSPNRTLRNIGDHGHLLTPL